MRLRLWQKILVIMLLPIVFELGFAIALGALLKHTERVKGQFEHSRKVAQAFDAAVIDELQSYLLVDSAVQYGNNPAEAANRFDQLLASSRESGRVIESEKDIRPEIAALAKDIPEIFDSVNKVIDKAKRIYTDESIPWRKKPGMIRADAFMVMVQYKPLMDAMLKAHNDLDALEPQELSRLRFFILSLTAIGLLISLGLSLILARVMFRDVVTRLATIEHNAQLVASGKALMPPVKGTDEIADLDRSMHKAADAIAEARQKEFAILEKSLDVLFSLNQRHRITAVGDAVQNAWRYSPDQLLGRSFLTLFPEGIAPRAVRSLEQAARSGTEQEFETELLCGDGTTREILWRVVFDNDSKTFHCVAHDISERRAVERKRQELIAVAGRHLSAPLNAVSERLRRVSDAHGVSEGTDVMRKMLLRSENNIERLTALIDDLLDIEQMETGKIVLNTACVPVMPLCEGAIAAVSPLAQKLAVSIEAPALAIDILADRRKIEQVLINLLSNAVKYSPRGSSVRVAVRQLQDLAEISVSDQGPGIEEADRELIFERFYQTRNQSESGVKSTGLGLTIAKLIVLAHNGNIGVESEVGKGSRFWLQIPLFETSAGETQ